MVWSSAKVTPPVVTVTVAAAAWSSAISVGSTVRVNVGWSLAEMVMFLVPTRVAPSRAAIVIVSAGSASRSSSAATVAVPAGVPAAIVMLAGVIV